MNELKCPDLRKLAAGRYRVSWDPAYDPRHKRAEHQDPWYAQLPGRYGTIYPYGCKNLAVEIDGHRKIAKELSAMGLRCIQDGDTEKALMFPPERFEEVAALVKLKKRRRLTPEQKAASAERLTPFKFRSTKQIADAPGHEVYAA